MNTFDPQFQCTWRYVPFRQWENGLGYVPFRQWGKIHPMRQGERRRHCSFLVLLADVCHTRDARSLRLPGLGHREGETVKTISEQPCMSGLGTRRGNDPPTATSHLPLPHSVPFLHLSSLCTASPRAFSLCLPVYRHITIIIGKGSLSTQTLFF